MSNLTQIEKNLINMLRIRLIEERLVELYQEQEIRCPMHLSIGQEAVAVGVCNALDKQDWVFSGHRNHAHYLAKGGDLFAFVSELYGRSTGCCSGKGGSMHLTDTDSGFIAATPIVGSTIPVAVGAAYRNKMLHSDRLTVVFFGDAAIETGVFHESLNFALVHELPILFVCENNLYSVYSPLSVRQSPKRAIIDIAEGHGIESYKCDGNNVEEVFSLTTKVRLSMRQRIRPIFFELSTYRWREHCGPNFDNDLGYRTEDEYQRWKENDPIDLAKNNVSNIVLMEGLDSINTEIDAVIDRVKGAPFPEAKDALLHIFAERPINIFNENGR
jgi:TPP-dependent pyruvate/acetoin dehydrogenase alpha subunit